LPNRYNLDGGGSFLKLLLLKRLYLKKYTTGQMNRKIPPPLDKTYVKKKIGFFKVIKGNTHAWRKRKSE
jgi:hypothetical protein